VATGLQSNDLNESMVLGLMGMIDMWLPERNDVVEAVELSDK
jgi:hypothetical protein